MSFAYNPFTDNLDYKASGGGAGVSTITGVANRTLITGTASDPIIDIAPTYVGQTSITTLGTVATGVWNATAVGTTHGGTGLTSAGSSGNVLTSNGTIWTSAAPVGNVAGPASSTNNDLVVFNGTTGKIIKDTGISSTAPTFSGNVTSLTRMIVPYDTTAGEGMYFSDGRSAFRQVGTGAANFFFGGAGNSSLSGIANTGAGQACLASLTNGQQNTASGNGCLGACNSGGGNTASGYLSMGGLTAGANNTAFGWGSLSSGNGNNNCAFGFQALQSLLTGANNIALGIGAGTAYTSSESGNIVIDSGGVAGESNTIRIGNVQTAFYGAGINGVTVTGTAVLCASNGQLGTVVSSERYKENILDMPMDVSVMNLRPVMFNYRSDKYRNIQFGLIAEEVDRDFPYLCFYKDGKPESVKYHELCVFLLAELQRIQERVAQLESK